MWIFMFNRDAWQHTSDPQLILTMEDVVRSPHCAWLCAWLKRQA